MPVTSLALARPIVHSISLGWRVITSLGEQNIQMTKPPITSADGSIRVDATSSGNDVVQPSSSVCIATATGIGGSGASAVSDGAGGGEVRAKATTQNCTRPRERRAVLANGLG